MKEVAVVDMGEIGAGLAAPDERLAERFLEAVGEASGLGDAMRALVCEFTDAPDVDERAETLRKRCGQMTVAVRALAGLSVDMTHPETLAEYRARLEGLRSIASEDEQDDKMREWGPTIRRGFAKLTAMEDAELARAEASDDPEFQRELVMDAFDFVHQFETDSFATSREYRAPAIVVQTVHVRSRGTRRSHAVCSRVVTRSAGGGSSGRPRSSDDEPTPPPLGASFATRAVSTPSRSEGDANARAGSQILFGISFAGCVEAVRAGVTTSFAPARTRPSAVIA